MIRYRVSRGGSWSAFAQGCRSARRLAFNPGLRLGFLGFRPILRRKR